MQRTALRAAGTDPRILSGECHRVEVKDERVNSFTGVSRWLSGRGLPRSRGKTRYPTRAATSGLEERLEDLLIDRVDGCQADPRDRRSLVPLGPDDLAVEIARIVA